MRCLTCILSIVLYAVIFFGMAEQADALNLVTDGGFTNLTNIDTNSYNSNGGQLGYNVNAVGWSNTPATNVNGTGANYIGYNFLFTTNMVNNTNSVYGNDGAALDHGSKPSPSALALYNNISGSSTNFTNPPGGGNFIAADGAFQSSAITQTITNLVIGQNYLLSFYYAGAQQTGYSGTNTENWQVTMANTTNGAVYTSYTTPTLTNASHGFTGWDLATVSFKASNSSEVLSFLASGTPSGQPPFSLLANVSIVAVPEASSVIAAGLLLLILCAAPLLKSFKEKEGETLGSTEGLGSGHP